MNPIQFTVKKTVKTSAQEICEKVLDVTTWSSFDGHGVLPGIEKAEYEERTDEMIGSRIRVTNSDGTQHLEEILEWEAGKKLIMKMSEFPPSLSYIATHFIEQWNFKKSGENETLVTRKFQLYPTSFLTRMLLGQIAALFEKAVERHLDEMANDMSKN